jgi:hypothetical protein
MKFRNMGMTKNQWEALEREASGYIHKKPADPNYPCYVGDHKNCSNSRYVGDQHPCGCPCHDTGSGGRKKSKPTAKRPSLEPLEQAGTASRDISALRSVFLRM